MHFYGPSSSVTRNLNSLLNAKNSWIDGDLQVDNAANQREHLILLLSNSQSRLGVLVDTENKVL